MLQFDYYISPAETCSVSNVFVMFGSEYVTYSSSDVNGLDSDCGLRSEDCRGISGVTFCQDGGQVPVSVPPIDSPSILATPSPSALGNVSDAPSSIRSNDPSMDSSNIQESATPSQFYGSMMPAVSVSTSPSKSCYKADCGASTSFKSDTIASDISSCADGLQISNEELPVQDAVSGG